ncbi:MAG: DMT family transporter [Flavobacterium sp.]|uniref:DMT family transporter n=1 Tax=Flavobacterium sp. TaxID=239 RepID=UPI00121F605C|nr:DMT family transporter [Flavobacterium sp.]RZJ66210.1 MAG: DMT family transporter [Flavobacterium sp.]
MPNANLKSYLNLHLIVFIWGFTGVLGELISIGGTDLVWYRMLLASVFLFAYLVVTRQPFILPWKVVLRLTFVGLLIAIHWVLFFTAIKVSNVSITLAMFSMGAFFAAVLEPFFYDRKMLWYEVLFGLVIIAALCLILNVEFRYFTGMVLALTSVFFGVIFTLLNGKLTKEHNPTVITLYEFVSGFLFVTVYLAINNSFTPDFFKLSGNDWLLLLLLASVCTAYAFTASVEIMRRLTPYTVMLTTNLEPVYGIVMAWFIIGETERMSTPFYFGAALIIAVVVLNGIVKQRTRS